MIGQKSSKSLQTTFGALVAAIALLGSVKALNNGLGLTPPMGWNTWNKYYCDINQTVIYTNTD